MERMRRMNHEAKTKSELLHEVESLRQHSAEFDAIAAAQQQAGQLIGIIGLSNDITARKRAERRHTVQYAVSQVLADSATLADAASCILQAIGESLEWDYGALWKVDQRDNLLVCVATWHTPV